MRMKRPVGRVNISAETGTFTLDRSYCGKLILWDEDSASDSLHVVLPASPKKGDAVFFNVNGPTGDHTFFVRPNTDQVILAPASFSTYGTLIPDSYNLSYCFSEWFDYIDYTGGTSQQEIQIIGDFGIGIYSNLGLYLYYTDENVAVPIAPIDPEHPGPNPEDQVYEDHKLWSSFFWGNMQVIIDEWT